MTQLASKINGCLSPNGSNGINNVHGEDQHGQPSLLVDPSLLPSSKATTLQLVHPTNEENDRQLRTNATSWKGSLKLEQYLRREELLANQDLTRDGGWSPWVLTDSKLPRLPNGERVVLCGVESFFKRAIIKKPGSHVVENVVCQGVGSVFSPVEFRKRGYAGVMMEMLAKELRHNRRDNDNREVAFSVLFSDIGKQFYAKNGWEPFESTHISLPARSAASPVGDEPLPVTKPIETQDLPTLCQLDEAMLRRWFDHQQPRDKVLAALVPDLQTILWMHAREDFICKELMARFPAVKGAHVSLGEGKNAWCYWTRMYYNENVESVEKNTFYILRLVVDESIDGTQEGEVAVAALLQAAQREAGLWNMECVTLWNPSQQTVRGAARALGKQAGEVEIVDRPDESITSLLWYGDELNPGQKSRDVVDWVANEKFGWC